MRKVAVVAGGLCPWGVRKASWRELVQEAGKAVLDAAPDIGKKEIDSLFVGAASPDRFAFQCHVAPLVADMLGIYPTRMVARTELACASGQAAIRFAWLAIASGMSEVALCLGVEKMNLPDMREAQTTMTAVLDREWDAVHGASAPPFFAMCAQHHMLHYGTTRHQLSLVSEKNHGYSSTNRYAHFQEPVSAAKVEKSAMVAPPLRLYDCSGITDGAAAVILASEERAKRLTDTPVWIKGSGQCASGNNSGNWKSLDSWESMREAARTAYSSAGITARDVDIAEVHDCFTISEIIGYEELDFCRKGDGGKFIEDGQSKIGGKVAVNTRGGLLGCGHPLGATGIAQVIEIYEQMQAKVPRARQVPDPQVGLTHNLSGAANVHSILVLGRDA
jgi:acetyl-CoA C-acetyltransferase